MVHQISENRKLDFLERDHGPYSDFATGVLESHYNMFPKVRKISCSHSTNPSERGELAYLQICAGCGQGKLLESDAHEGLVGPQAVHQKTESQRHLQPRVVSC